MIDIRQIRKNPALIQAKLQTKDPLIDLSKLCELDQNIRESKTHVEQLKAKRNDFSQKIGELKRKGEDASDLLNQVSSFGDEIHLLDHKIKKMEDLFLQELLRSGGMGSHLSLCPNRHLARDREIQSPRRIRDR